MDHVLLSCFLLCLLTQSTARTTNYCYLKKVRDGSFPSFYQEPCSNSLYSAASYFSDTPVSKGITFYFANDMILVEKGTAILKKRMKCRKKFLRNFPGGFYGEKYLSWERDYKWNAHLEWKRDLNKREYERLLEEGNYPEIAQRAIKIETRTNLLFSFEKMALRDGVRPEAGARLFAEGLYSFLYAQQSTEEGFGVLKQAFSQMPRKQTRVATWPVLTVFPFIAKPEKHIYLKPRVTREAAENYGFDFEYRSGLNWGTYQSLLLFSEEVRKDIVDLHPRDMIDIQSFIWVQGSDEYE